MNRPLGCLTGSALITAGLATVVILGAAAASGNRIFSPGRLSAAAGERPIGGITSHAELEARCDACHVAIWSGDRMGDRCLACHTEVTQEISSGGGLHGGFATRANCRDCHTDHDGVAASLTLAIPRGFPHERTGHSLAAHPMRDEGGAFACRDCHLDSLQTFSGSSCLTCHQVDDPAYMAEHTADFGTDCLACHDGVDTYGEAFDHATYPLVGRHDGPRCTACHRGATTTAALRAAPTECSGCHARVDPHDGQFPGDCAACHVATGWKDVTFDHGKAAFPLTGAHRSVTCQGCHVGGVFKGTPITCVACHARPASHGSAFSNDCKACHTTTAWRPATFNGPHPFPMNHGDASATCATCHPSSLTRYSCTGCHEHNPSLMVEHHKEVTGYSVTGCLRCHPGGGPAEDD